MKTKLIIPMAGEGSRFKEKGYRYPKPLIKAKDEYMYKWALKVFDNLDIEYDELIFIVNHRHDVIFRICDTIQKEYPESKFILLSETTEGAALTVKSAGAYLNPDDKVIISNCDHYMDYYSSSSYKWEDMVDEYDSGMVLFKNYLGDPKYSFAQYNGNIITEVREKDPFTEWATAGIYYWSKASMMMNSIDSMIEKNKRVNGEFYLCPSYNETIEQGYSVGAVEIQNMYCLGTPEELETFNRIANIDGPLKFKNT